jgi:hypothetical protein
MRDEQLRWQIVESDVHAGKSKSKLTCAELSKILSSLRIALSVSTFQRPFILSVCPALSRHPNHLSP